jgi:EmrB/QacA subfamily drug resistance transporter
MNSKLVWLLAVSCVAQFMVILDLSIVNVALPSIQVSLNFTAINLQWVVDAYAIAFAGFLMLGGRAADHFGQRRTLVAALGTFAIASLVGGIAVNQLMLISARGVQGLSGALMAAASLAAITSAFEQGPARHRAISLWGAMNGAGGAAGVLFGGIITQEFGWRWVLLINPPIAIASAFVAFVVVTDRPKDEIRAVFDLGGALSLTGGLMVLVYGIVNIGALGWNAPGTFIPIVVGLILLALFPFIESRAVAPLVPPKALTKPLRIANVIVLLFSAALFPMWYLSSLYLQQVLGLSPLNAGLAFLPMALMIMVSARSAGHLVSRFGVRAVLSGGLAMMTSGLLLFARIGTSGSAIGFVVLPGLLVALGIGLSIVPSTIAATQGAGPGREGLSSGLVNTSRQVGGAVGIAILISIATQYTSHLIGQGRDVSVALTNGFRVAYLISAVFVALAAVIAFGKLPKPTALEPLRSRLRLPISVAVVVAGFIAVDFVAAGAPGAPIGAYTSRGAYSYASAPALHPPVIRTNSPTVSGELAPGFILTANFFNLAFPPLVGQSGPLILNNALQPVWFKPVPTNVVASNTALQTYQAKPVLSWWQGVVSPTGATESGKYVVVNQHYQTVATLKGVDGWILTLHDMKIVGNDAWVTANKNIPMNLTAYGGAKNGALVDSAVQEYNLSTGRLVRSWDALTHIALGDSHTPPPTNGFPWDAYHVNSIDLTGNGTFLVSMRDLWAAYLVNIKTGKIEWTLGGKHSNFTFGPGAEFQWQHDVVLDANSEVTLFDDHCCEITGSNTYLAATGPSRALVLKIDQASRKVTLTAQFQHGNGSSAYMGSAEVLGNANVFVGWGDQPYFSEYSRSGKLLLDAVLPSPDLTYRATQIANWVGLPTSPPSSVARQHHGTTTVYASWNGATQVESWRVLAGPTDSRMKVVSTKAKSGFETVIPVGSTYQVFKVEALDAQGQLIGTSPVFAVTT